MKNWIHSTSIFFCLFLGHKVPGQMFQNDSVVSIAKIRTIESKILGESRPIMLHLPSDYKKSKEHYPVLYLLDAENDFVHTIGIIDFLTSIGRIPELIVLGIVNTNRSRDLTPEAPDDEEAKEFWGEIGRADQFRQFIRTELIPFLNSNYRVENYHILRGQSFGGLFGIHDMLSLVNTFNAYILSSPAVKWNNDHQIKRLSEIGSYDLFQHSKLFLAEAEMDWSKDNGISEFKTKLLSIPNAKSNFKYHYFKGEGHYSLVFDATFKGITFIFKNWNPNPTILNAPDSEALEKHYTQLSQEFGYPITVPMNKMIELANNNLRQRKFDNGIHIYKRNLEMYPDSPEAIWHLGDAYYLKGDYQQALGYFIEALKMAEENGYKEVTNFKRSVADAKSRLKN